MVNYDNRNVTCELRAFHGELAEAVRSLHGSRCPCCGNPMVKPRRRNEINLRRRDRISIAHDRAHNLGGDVEIWVYACQGCNADQRALGFREWSAKLGRDADKRAERVAALADVIDTFKGSTDALRQKPHARPGDLARAIPTGADHPAGTRTEEA